MKDTSLKKLIDTTPLQAHRLRNRHFERALAAGRFDPYPDGTHALGEPNLRGALAQNSGNAYTAIANGAFSSFDSALPDYIQTALQTLLHNDDESFRAFLSIFDRRLLELRLRAEESQILIASQDTRGNVGVNILEKLLRAVGRKGTDIRYAKLILPFLSRVRSIEGLRSLVSCLTGRSVVVSASFDNTDVIDPSCKTRLSNKAHHSACLGRGAILGRFGRAPVGRLSILIDCRNQLEFKELVENTTGITELKSVVFQYLRDPVPVTFFAEVERHMVKDPEISSTQNRANQLGVYKTFIPQRTPNERILYKIS